MSSLYSLDSELAQILSVVDETGELPADMEARLDDLQENRVSVINWICKAIRNHKAREVGIQAEIDRLKAALTTEQNIQERLKRWIFESMIKLGEKKMETPLFKLWTQRNGAASVTVAPEVDVHELPGRFKRIKVEVNSVELAAAFKAGEVLPDGITVEVGSHLRIK